MKSTKNCISLLETDRFLPRSKREIIQPQSSAQQPKWKKKKGEATLYLSLLLFSNEWRKRKDQEKEPVNQNSFNTIGVVSRRLSEFQKGEWAKKTRRLPQEIERARGRAHTHPKKRMRGSPITQTKKGRPFCFLCTHKRNLEEAVRFATKEVLGFTKTASFGLFFFFFACGRSFDQAKHKHKEERKKNTHCELRTKSDFERKTNVWIRFSFRGCLFALQISH